MRGHSSPPLHKGDMNVFKIGYDTNKYVFGKV